MSNWGIPQWLVAAMLGLDMAIGVVRGGKRVTIHGARYFVYAALLALALAWGGFWK